MNKNKRNNIKTSNNHPTFFRINNLIYYIRCPNCNYLLNDIPPEFDYGKIIYNNRKSKNNERGLKKIEYKKELEERKQKEKKKREEKQLKEREEKQLKERKEREERLKKQKEERDKKEKIKYLQKIKEEKEKENEIKGQKIKNEKEMPRKIQKIKKVQNIQLFEELQRSDFEVYKQNKKHIIINNKEYGNGRRNRNNFINLKNYTVYKPATKINNILTNVRKPELPRCHDEFKIYGNGNNIGFYESFGNEKKLKVNYIHK